MRLFSNTRQKEYEDNENEGGEELRGVTGYIIKTYSINNLFSINYKNVFNKEIVKNRWENVSKTGNISKGTERIREPSRYPEIESTYELKNSLDRLKIRAELEETGSVSWKSDWVGLIGVRELKKNDRRLRY